jgi:hypothetical protein
MGNYNATKGEVLFQTRLHPDVIKALRMMASREEATIKDYLSACLKDILLIRAQNLNDPGLYNSINEMLSKVDFI